MARVLIRVAVVGIAVSVLVLLTGCVARETRPPARFEAGQIEASGAVPAHGEP